MRYKALRVLVTGGSGYLGTHVLRFFQAEDFSRRSHLDVLSALDATKAGDYEVVIHLAAQLSKNPADAETCFRTNIEGTVNLLREMKPNSVFIFASTKDVYGAHADNFSEVPETCSTDYENHSALEWSKLIAERYVEYYAAQRNFRSCVFRLSTVYARPSEGNENGFVTHYVESVKRGWPLRLPLDGKPVRDVLHVDDFARACSAFIDSDMIRGLYNLGGGPENALSLREIIDKVAEIIQCNPVFDESAPLPPPVPLNYISDLARVRRDLGWYPQIGVEEGLKSLI
ncbi:MAG TPA: NAD-dependent epimerase/dehydratase family protein [Pyrinomonadaceae bacterium]|nr:NAD-dependent epimerase/dehydratase family protein [Pyrinomonadaceae bacterium]